jgi:tol-pal system protein YbgF
MICRTLERCLPALLLSAAAWVPAGAYAQLASPQSQAQPQMQPADSQARAERPEAMPQSSATYGLLSEIESLKAEVSRLRGQSEMLEHKLESLSKRQSDLYLDLDRRVEDLRKQAKEAAQAQAAPVTSAAAGTAAQGDPLAESKAYEAALEQFKAGNYDKAIAGFADFLKAYPNSTLAANAQYWTGYAYYAKKDYKNALEQQTRLVSTYPQSPKVPDALLNIANCQMELNDSASARKNFQEIVARYPGTNAAALAAKRLELLK